MEEKKRPRVQTKMDPCFYKRFFCKVASPVLFGADLTCLSIPIRSLAGWALVGTWCCGCKLVAPPFSFRCRFPGAHIARYFFTIHSYFLLSRSAPRGLDPRRGPKPPALAVLRR